MKCPNCNYNKTKTVWVKDKGDFTSRSRECPKCNQKFQTKEMTSDDWNYKRRYYNLIKTIKKLLDKN
jgi:transcriptional regulator NrdR family protein